MLLRDRALVALTLTRGQGHAREGHVGLAGVSGRRTRGGGACLALFCAWGLTGCLGDPPRYEDPRQIPPFIVKSGVSPALDVFHEISPSTPFDITVPFRSEDLGEELLALVFIDFVPGEEAGRPETLAVAPGYYDQARAVEMQVLSPDSLGCHTMSLVLTHEQNFVGGFVREYDAAAWITWWFNVTDTADGDEEVAVTECPTSGGP